MKNIFVLLSLLPLLLFANPKTLYISPDGDDSWSGRLASANSEKTDGPLASVEKAIQVWESSPENIDYEIIVQDGLYYLSSPIVFKPGPTNKKLVLKNYAEKKPILSGGTHITNWIKKPHDLWTADVSHLDLDSTVVRQLFINGERRYRARTPNIGFFQIEENPGLGPNAPYNTGAHKFKYTKGDIDSKWTNQKDIEVVVHHFWVDTHLPVSSINEEDRIINFDRKSRRKLTDDFGNKGAVYYVDNVFEKMDRAGEWYLSKSSKQLYYLAKTGEDLNNSTVIIPQLEYLIKFDGHPINGDFVENVHFEGISFQHTKYDLPKNTAGDLQAAVHVPGAIVLKGAHNISFKNCEIKNVGTYALEFEQGSRNNKITHCEISNVGAGGIRLNGGDANSDSTLRTGNNSLTDNHIFHLGQIWHAGVGILSQNSDNNTISHNHIHHMYYTGISVGWVWGYKPSVSVGNKIEHNHIHHIGQGILSDMGGVYLLGPSPGTVVRNNLVHDINSRGYGGWGLYTDEGSTGILLENNVVYRTKSAGFHQHYGKENIIRNNIFAFGKESQIQRTRNEEHVSFTFENNIVYYSGEKLIDKNWKENNYKFDKNLYWRTDGYVNFQNWSLQEWREKGQDIHSQIAGPLFADPAADDFNLRPESPAFDLGFVPIDLTNVGQRVWPDSVIDISYLSSADNSNQPAMFYNSGSTKKKPLLVGLHTWSSSYKQSDSAPYAKWCIQKDWVFIHPNFRGPNKRPQATGSDLVVADILSAVEYAKQNANVDPKRIYLIGTSGGGYTSLLMAGKAPDIWAGVSAWVPITDLNAWYEESIKLEPKYANHIVASCGGTPGKNDVVDSEYFNRSPINFLFNAKKVPLDINAGIFDGHSSSVPIGHSLKAFNTLAKLEEKISDSDIDYFEKEAMVPAHLQAEKNDPYYNEKNVLFRRKSNNVRITIFNGGHQGIPFAGLSWLEKLSK